MTVRITRRPYTPPRVHEISRRQLVAACQMLIGPAAPMDHRAIKLREQILYAPQAWPSSRTLGRLETIPEDHRTPHARDCDRILYMKHFAALTGKTQVFSFPRNPRIHNRRFHVDKVAAVGRDIGRELFLNEYLIEAIGRGHDLGHTPFGHDGETALSAISLRVLGKPFKHNRHSLRVIDVIEKKNLTAEVRNGIISHCGERLDAVLEPGPIPKDLANMTDEHMPYTLEGCVIRVSDIIVFLAHDYMDAMTMGIVKPSDLPEIVKQRLGTDPDDMIGIMVNDLVRASRGKNYITMSDEMLEARQALFRFDYERVIGSKIVQAARLVIPEIMETLFTYYTDKRGFDPQSAIDEIASLTDRQARARHNAIKRRDR